MNLKDIKYDAFISYRHSDIDQYVAENLHKMLESFRLPKGVTGARDKKRIERVFRDRDELPLASNLAEPIEEALQNSEFLIVICTPRLPESEWCRKEIETFIKLHGREHIFAVLAEGEPSESFPRELLEESYEYTDETGTLCTGQRNIEPLAADVRGKDKKSIHKKMKEELIRLTAPMFGLNYDDLKRRHKEQRMKKIVTASVAVSAFLLVFGAISFSVALTIHKQSVTVNKNYSVSLSVTAEELLHRGNGRGAIYTALKATENVKTDRSLEALAKASHIYTPEGMWVPVTEYQDELGIGATILSADGTRLAICNTMGGITFYDTESREKLGEISCGFYYGDAATMSFSDADHFICYTTNGMTCFQIGEETGEILTENIGKLCFSGDRSRFALIMDGSVMCFDTATCNVVFQTEAPVTTFSEGAFLMDGSRFAVTTSSDLDTENKLLILNADTGMTESETITGKGMASSVAGGKHDFYISMLYAEENAAMISTFVCSINGEKGNVLWKSSVTEGTYRDLHYYQDGTTEYLYVLHGEGPMTMDGANGKILYTTQPTGTPLLSFPVGSQDIVDVLMADGTVLSYPVTTGMCDYAGSYCDTPELMVASGAVAENHIYLQFNETNYVAEYVPLHREDRKNIGSLENLDFSGQNIILFESIYSDQLGREEPAEPDITYDFDETSLLLYHTGEEKEYVKKELDVGYVNSAIISSDGKYIGICYRDNSVEICETKGLKTIKQLYQDYNWVLTFDYIAENDCYLMDGMQNTVVLNSKMEKTAVIPKYYGQYECIGFDTDHNSFLIHSMGDVYAVPYCQEKDLIQNANEQLNHYVPDEQLRKEYGIQ